MVSGIVVMLTMTMWESTKSSKMQDNVLMNVEKSIQTKLILHLEILQICYLKTNVVATKVVHVIRSNVIQVGICIRSMCFRNFVCFCLNHSSIDNHIFCSQFQMFLLLQSHHSHRQHRPNIQLEGTQSGLLATP